MVYVYYGGASGRLRRFVPNPPLAPQKQRPLALNSFVFLFQAGRREDCDISLLVLLS